MKNRTRIFALFVCSIWLLAGCKTTKVPNPAYYGREAVLGVDDWLGDLGIQTGKKKKKKKKNPHKKNIKIKR